MFRHAIMHKVLIIPQSSITLENKTPTCAMKNDNSDDGWNCLEFLHKASLFLFFVSFLRLLYSISEAILST